MNFKFLTPEQVEALTPEKRGEYLRKLQEHLAAQQQQATTVADEVKKTRELLLAEQQARLQVEMQGRVNQLVQQYPLIAVDALASTSMKDLEDSVPAAVELGNQRLQIYGGYAVEQYQAQQQQQMQEQAQYQAQQSPGPSVFGPAGAGGAPNMPRFVDPRLQQQQGQPQFQNPQQRPGQQIQPVYGAPYGAPQGFQPQFQQAQPQQFQVPPGYAFDPNTGNFVPMQQQVYNGFPQGQMQQMPQQQFQPGQNYGNVPQQFQQPFQPQAQYQGQPMQQQQGPAATQQQQQQYANAASRRRTGGHDPMAPAGLRGLGQQVVDPMAQQTIDRYQQQYASQMYDQQGFGRDHNARVQVQGAQLGGVAGGQGYTRQQGFYAHRQQAGQPMQVQWRN